MGDVKWSEFLKINEQYGSLEVGKKPGILNIGLAKNGKLTKHTIIKRLF